MRQFHTIVPQNTVGQWVDAFNNNALAAADHTAYLGEILFSSVLYTGLETICGNKIEARKYVDLNGIFPEEFYFDNWYCYFRNENKIKLIEHQVIDLSDYKDNTLYFLFINSERGWRVSVNSTVESGDEIRICRFMIDTDGTFIQCYLTFPRFGYFGANDHYPELVGLDAEPLALMNLSREDGTINYNGFSFDEHSLPDSLKLNYRERIPLLFNSVDNKVYYGVTIVQDEEGNPVLDEEGRQVHTVSSQDTVYDCSFIINYENQTMENVPNNKYTVQRLLYDIYVDNFVVQYGEKYYDTIDDALNAVYSLSVPFPFTDVENNIVGNAYPMIGIIVCRSDFTDLTDPEQCRIVQIRSKSTDIRDTELLATDSYARSLISSLNRDFDVIRERVTSLEIRMTEAETELENHINDKGNPHNVTPEQLGMGSFRIPDSDPNAGTEPYVPGIMYTPATLPISTRTKQYIDAKVADINSKIDKLGDIYVRKVGDTMTGSLTINQSRDEFGLIVNGTKGAKLSQMTTTSGYITVNNIRFYVGNLPNGAPTGSYGVKG